MRLPSRFLSLSLSLVFWACRCFAQDAVPTEIMHNTIMIKNGNTFGTAFKIQYKNHVYLITARHVVVGMPTESAIIQYRSNNKWEDIKTIKRIFPTSSDVDIAIFSLNEEPSEHSVVTPMVTSSGVTFGQPVWFIGFIPLELKLCSLIIIHYLS